jgi:hypothetical protein
VAGSTLPPKVFKSPRHWLVGSHPQDAYELDAFKPNLARTEADKRIAMLTAKLKLFGDACAQTQIG